MLPATFSQWKRGNDAFGYTVVLVFLESSLSTADLAKMVLSRSGANTHAARWRIVWRSVPDRLQPCSTVLIAKAIGSNIDNPKINPKHTFRYQQFGIIKVTHSSQILKAYPLSARERLSLAVKRRIRSS
jgi:hypothetical protein